MYLKQDEEGSGGDLTQVTAVGERPQMRLQKESLPRPRMLCRQLTKSD